MAYAFINDAVAADFNSGTALATGNFPTNTAVGDLIVADMLYFPDGSVDTACSCADTLGNTYTEFSTHGWDASNTANLRGFYAISASAGANSVTLTPAAASSFRASRASKFSGIATSSPLIGDISSNPSAPGTGTDAISSGNINVTSQPAMYFSIAADLAGTATPVAGTGFTGRPATTNRILAEDKRVTATGNVAGLFTAGSGAGADNYLVLAAAFLEITAGGSTPRNLLLLGVG